MKTPEEIDRDLRYLEELKELNKMVLTKEQYIERDKNRVLEICEESMADARSKYPEGSKELAEQELENRDFYGMMIDEKYDMFSDTDYREDLENKDFYKIMIEKKYNNFSNKDYKELLSYNKDREVELTLEYKYGITEFKSEDPSNIFDIIEELKKVQIDEEDKAKINAFIRKEKRIRVDYDKMVAELAKRGMTIDDLDNECFDLSLDNDMSKLFDSNGKYIRN